MFPHGNGPDHSKSHGTPQSIAENASLSDRSTQTDPGVWTPVANRKDLHHSKTPSAPEKVRKRCPHWETWISTLQMFGVPEISTGGLKSMKGKLLQRNVIILWTRGCKVMTLPVSVYRFKPEVDVA